jgi:GT2 family glycosyltransferase
LQRIDCTIIIINWNSWDYLFPCIEAVYQQTFQGFHLIVVDNASSDQAPASLLNQYPRLTFIQNHSNVGFAAANNQAIQIADDCQWIVLLNPDTIPSKTWLERLCKAPTVYPDFSFFGSRLIMADATGRIDGVGDVYHMSGLVWRSGHGLDASSLSDEPKEIFSPCAAAAMYRRDDVLSVGGFDEDYFCYNEDVDLGFRLRLAGGRALSVPDSVVLHHGSGTTSVRSDFAVYYGHRNLVWTWFKDMPMVMLWLFLPVHVLYNIACVVLYIVRGQGAVILQAKWDAVKGLRKVWSKRKTIHVTSRASLWSIWKIINTCLIIGPINKYRKIS